MRQPRPRPRTCSATPWLAGSLSTPPSLSCSLSLYVALGLSLSYVALSLFLLSLSLFVALSLLALSVCVALSLTTEAKDLLSDAVAGRVSLYPPPPFLFRSKLPVDLRGSP